MQGSFTDMNLHKNIQGYALDQIWHGTTNSMSFLEGVFYEYLQQIRSTEQIKYNKYTKQNNTQKTI